MTDYLKVKNAAYTKQHIVETDCLAVCVHVLLHWNPQSTACMDLSQHRGNHTECIHKSHRAIIWGLRLEFHLSVSFCKCSDVNQQACKQKLLRRRFYSGHIAVTHNQLEKNCEHFGDSIPRTPSLPIPDQWVIRWHRKPMCF